VRTNESNEHNPRQVTDSHYQPVTASENVKHHSIVGDYARSWITVPDIRWVFPIRSFRNGKPRAQRFFGFTMPLPEFSQPLSGNYMHFCPFFDRWANPGEKVGLLGI
jgi:hypothetical protein